MLRHPAQPGGQTKHGAAVGQGVGLGNHLHRLPRRNQAPHRARAGVPREDVGQRMVDDAFVLNAHIWIFAATEATDCSQAGYPRS